MTDVLSVLELALRPQREGGAPLPVAVLEDLMRGTGAAGGALGRGPEVLARSGAEDAAMRRYELPAWREAFWIELQTRVKPLSSQTVALVNADFLDGSPRAEEMKLVILVNL